MGLSIFSQEILIYLRSCPMRIKIPSSYPSLKSGKILSPPMIAVKNNEEFPAGYQLSVPDINEMTVNLIVYKM